MSNFHIIFKTGQLLLLILLPFAVISAVKLHQQWNLMETLGVTFSLLVTVSFLGQLLQAVYTTFIGPNLGHSIDLRSQGKWALVTGATDGIGKAYTQELAKRGINVVLLSRSEDKLKKAELELQKEFGIQTEIIAVDFTKGQEIYDVIRQKLKHWDLEIGVLINNVGMAYPFPEYFADLPDRDQFCEDIINCNILSTTLMTGIVLPSMVERGKGVVVNVGSVTSRIEAPFMAVYGATKAYMEKFTHDLALEYGEKGITFQYIYPSYVATNLSRVKESTWNIPTPEQFVAVAIKSIGIQEQTAIWLPHRIVCFCLRWFRFLRPQANDEISRRVLKGVWLYAKKNRMNKELKMK